MAEARVIIAGSRSFSDYGSLCEKAGSVIGGMDNIVIISGTARGADSLGERYAREHGLPTKRFPAQWRKYGNAAGPIRNNEMAEYATADGAKGILIAFWDGKSSGTRSMIDTARRKGLEVHVFEI